MKNVFSFEAKQIIKNQFTFTEKECLQLLNEQINKGLQSIYTVLVNNYLVSFEFHNWNNNGNREYNIIFNYVYGESLEKWKQVLAI